MVIPLPGHLPRSSYQPSPPDFLHGIPGTEAEQQGSGRRLDLPGAKPTQLDFPGLGVVSRGLPREHPQCDWQWGKPFSQRCQGGCWSDATVAWLFKCTERQLPKMPKGVLQLSDVRTPKTMVEHIRDGIPLAASTRAFWLAMGNPLQTRNTKGGPVALLLPTGPAKCLAIRPVRLCVALGCIVSRHTGPGQHPA